MSLEGKATGQELRGKINNCDTLTISAYGIAVKNGFQGTEAEWLESLKGEKGDMPEGAILYLPQTLNSDQREQSRKNIGAMGADDAQRDFDHLQQGIDYAQEIAGQAVRFSEQNLLPEMQVQARKNIGAASNADLSSVEQIAQDAYEATFSVVSFNAQTLTPEQQEQVRQNIGAVSTDDLDNVRQIADGALDEALANGHAIDDIHRDLYLTVIPSLNEKCNHEDVQKAIEEAFANLPVYNGEVEEV